MGDEMLVVKPSPKDVARFFRKISINQETKCWNWTGACDSGGYGHVVYNRKLESSHRVMYAWFIEAIPRKKGKNIPQLDHVICQNKKCCNPFHLELVSFKENILRGQSPSAKHARQNNCKNGHELPKVNYIRKNGKKERVCLICKRKYHREYMKKYRLSH